jgi:hypothetical protein
MEPMMIWKAHVHLEVSPNTRGPLRDIGIVDVDGDAQEGSRVTFSFDEQTEVGLIERLDPRDWQVRPGTIPTVHIPLPNKLR